MELGRKVEGIGRGRSNACLRAIETPLGVAAVVMLFAAAPMLPAQTAHQHPKHKEDLKRQVEKLEETWRTAQLSDDADTMDKLLSDDYVGITMNGQVVTKMQQLDRMRTRTLALTKIQLDDVKIKVTGPTAVVNGKADVEGTNDGEPMHGTYRYTRVYTRLPSGAWKITNFEATRVGEPPMRRARGDLPPAGADGGLPPVPQKLVAGNGGRMR